MLVMKVPTCVIQYVEDLLLVNVNAPRNYGRACDLRKTCILKVVGTFQEGKLMFCHNVIMLYLL